MSRFRRTDSTERIDPGTRPPDALIPPVFVPLITEYDRISGQYLAAENAALGYRSSWDLQLETAQRDDAKTNALALRADPKAGTKTTAADALIRARDDAEARYASLRDARRMVELDLYELLSVECGNADYGKNLDAARAALAKTTAGLQAAVTKAVTACAVFEWVHYQKWDATERISIEELHPALLSAGPAVSNIAPVTAAQIIASLTRIADPVLETSNV